MLHSYKVFLVYSFLFLRWVFCVEDIDIQDDRTLRDYLEERYKVFQKRSGDDAGEPLILTKYIEENRLTEAREAAIVPTDSLLPDIDSYAGFFTVNKKYNGNLFFWYFPVMNQPVEDTPWIIWLQGGPGASSLYGLFTEIGPFYVTTDNYLEETKYSWGKNHSLLFIDNPVGTGFSFVDDDRGYATNQTTIGENLYDALQQFLTIFSELRKAPLTISGESYAGKHIPSLAIQIHRNRNEEQPINLHGLAIGNGFMDPKSLQRYSYFVREAGLVDDKTANIMKALEIATVKHLEEGNMVKAFYLFNNHLNIFMRESKLSNIYNYLIDEDPGLQGSFTDFIQQDDVRRSLHVGNVSFTMIGKVYRKLVPDFMGSSKSWMEELIQNYKVMCYNGHLDVIVAYHPSVNSYAAFNYPGSNMYMLAKRNAWYHNEKLVGYYKSVGNFSDVMIRGAGHMAPADQPAASLGMITAFTRGMTLEEDTGSLVKVDDENTLKKKLLK